MNAGRIVKIKRGERFYFEETGSICFINEGLAEIYASTNDRHERLFLLVRKQGEYFFGAFDEFQKVELFVFAKTDLSLVIYSSEAAEIVFNEFSEVFVAGMRDWFKHLTELSWVRYFVIQEDELVSQWVKDDFLSNLDNHKCWLTFLEHQNIFALLVSGQFNSLKKYFADRLQKRQAQKIQLMGASVDFLTGKDALGLLIGNLQSRAGDNIVYVVSRVAEYFKMDTFAINLPDDIMRQLRGMGLLKRLLNKSGMQTRRVTLDGEWYKKDSGVFIAANQQGFVAVLPEKPGKYRIYNENNPLGEIVTQEIAESISSEAYVCYAGFPARKLTIKDLLLFMYHQCWEIDYKYILFASFVAGFIPLLTPIITKTIFSDVIPIGDRQGLATITQVMMVAGFTMAAVSLVRSISVLRITSHIDMATEAALWSRLLSLPASFFKKYQTGELVQRMNGINEIKTFVTGEFVSSIFNTVFSLWSVLLMCYYSFKLTGIALLVWIVYFIIIGYIYRKSSGYQKNAIAAANKTSAQVIQIFNGLPKFRSQGAEEQAFYLWAKCFGEEWKWNLKLRWQSNYSGIINAVQPLILTLMLYYVAIYGMGENTVGKVQSSMSYAEFIGFQAAFSSFNTTLVSMIPLAVQFFNIRPHMENLRPILETEPETSVDKLEAGKLSGSIEVRNLSFAYIKDGPEVLKDISLKINPGESVAIVGRSGCGKSTFIRLLLGFEKPKRGAIYYDGFDMEELRLPSIRSQMGVVLQNGQLMAGDIFTNIIGTTSLTMKDAWIAAERVGLAADIRKMPMQMYTAISEGSGNISGGQKQRILIARSIVNNPRILLLDEATSALDNTTQAIVTESLSKMHCTQIIIAHRLSTIKNVDRILVIDDGIIAEDGDYETLMNKKGIFAKLAERQLV